MKLPFLNHGSSKARTQQAEDPIKILKEDHTKVKDLFDEFEKAEDRRSQMRIAKTAIGELKVHAAIEEEIFYPGVASTVDDEEMMEEATQEHHVVHMLIDELEGQNLAPEVFHAKFIVLAENVRHHIKEEEGEMMPKVDADEATMQELASRMAQRKEELLANPDSIRSRTNSRPRAQARPAKTLSRPRKSPMPSSRSKSTGSRNGRGTSRARASRSRS